MPKTINEITALNSCLKQYYNTNYLYILVLFSSVYIFKQTFCIPGSVILVCIYYVFNRFTLLSTVVLLFHKLYLQNLIAGSLFGSVVGFLLVCTLSSIGVSACYLLSKLCSIETLIVNYFPKRLISSKIAIENLVSEV